MAQQAQQPQPLNTNTTKQQLLPKQQSAGTGSPIATILSRFESPQQKQQQQQQQSTPKRPSNTTRGSSSNTTSSSSLSSKRLSASASATSIPAETLANPAATPTPAPSQTQTPPPPEDSSVAPGALRRSSLSFKLPIRVSTGDNNPHATNTNNRNRASSLPQQESQSQSPIDKKRHSVQRSLSSLTSIVENNNNNINTLPSAASIAATSNVDLQVPGAAATSTQSPKPSPKSPSKQFLLERGLLNPEELSNGSSSPEELQHSLQEQVFKFLTTMSSSSSDKSNTAEQQRGPAYPTSYPQNNGQLRPSMPQPGLPVPMPNLSGNANGPVGNLLKGPVDEKGNLTKAALMVGIKLDLEAEVHVTARVRGDILVGLY